ncbi:GTP cyclohydrolase 1 feedback regulatory protein [Rhipicephalus sanguineus]|nr:GTP cyclohydrolase 1 feedback regulatory protein [Rhipicephalus sanguineus]
MRTWVARRTQLTQLRFHGFHARTDLRAHCAVSAMPYLLISTQIRLENGPTIVGDRNSDPTLMEHLCARKITQPGNDFPEYRTDDPPRTVLNKLELMGYRVVAMSGIGQTCIWTLHKQ